MASRCPVGDTVNVLLCIAVSVIQQTSEVMVLQFKILPLGILGYNKNNDDDDNNELYLTGGTFSNLFSQLSLT